LEVKIVKKLQKAAIISAVVLMISIVPAFAINNTNNNNTGVQNGTSDQTSMAQNQHKYMCGQNGGTCGDNCGTGACDGEQHMYGQENGDAGAGNCDGANCQGANCANKT
jgi:hypothetical protein